MQYSTITDEQIDADIDNIVKLRYQQPLKFNLLDLLAGMKKRIKLVIVTIVVLAALGGILYAATPTPQFVIGIVIGLLLAAVAYILAR
ncbi:hypothetical protein CCP3SC15_2440009 [Gammaproteobacteria bacterium]